MILPVCLKIKMTRHLLSMLFFISDETAAAGAAAHQNCVEKWV
jgi:hypothetical protein